VNIKTSLFQIVKANNIYGISHSQENLEKTQELYKGIELTLSKQIFEDFKFSTSLKLREVEIKQSNEDDYIGKTPSYIPTNEVDVKAEYMFENIKFTSKMTYIGNRYGDISNNEKLGNYAVGTLGASFFTRFYDEDVKVDFNIKNILNRNYDLTSDTKGDSRNYIMNLSMMF
jgi:iron complex outermembrane receptor protein